MKLLLLSILLYIAAAQAYANTQYNAETLLGERLFQETRFAQFYAKHYDGDVNTPLSKGDPALEKTMRFFGLPPYQIPFTDSLYAGRSFNCRACHLVDEHSAQSELGMRSYSDYAARSPLPTRADGQIVSTRNSPSLMGSSLHRENFLLHYDGEFSSLADVVSNTLTGRNLGWLPGEQDIAIEHLCKVLRKDNGQSKLADEFNGLSYTELFSGTTEENLTVNQKFLLPETYRININKASCDKVFDIAVSLITNFIESLTFVSDENNYSPYDIFLRINNLPIKPNANETDLLYSKRLLEEIHTLKKENKLKFVTTNPNTDDGKFKHHDPDFKFGTDELSGLEVFFTQDRKNEESIGNCIACHAAPHFTDFGLHNVGITQIEYDNIHGFGAFGKLYVPTLSEREKNTGIYLPANHKNPKNKGIFRKPASQSNPANTDLGAWNIIFNRDYPLPQESIYYSICLEDGEITCKSKDEALSKSLATFKTPSLRNLGHSAPYMHNGQISDLHAVVGFYLAASINTRNKQFRNPDKDVAKIDIKPKNIIPLTLFLISLYED
ncbi:MAG: hypothetical protein AB8B92_04800 [Gammaproteobacteria bacterium]